MRRVIPIVAHQTDLPIWFDGAKSGQITRREIRPPPGVNALDDSDPPPYAQVRPHVLRLMGGPAAGRLALMAPSEQGEGLARGLVDCF